MVANWHMEVYGCCMATNPNFPEAVAQTVEAAIRAAGWTTESVADETGIPRRTLYRLLKSQNLTRSFQVGELDLIAHALNVSVNALLPSERGAA